VVPEVRVRFPVAAQQKKKTLPFGKVFSFYEGGYRVQCFKETRCTNRKAFEVDLTERKIYPKGVLKL
jgi:hypothetical protein